MLPTSALAGLRPGAARSLAILAGSWAVATVFVACSDTAQEAGSTASPGAKLFCKSDQDCTSTNACFETATCDVKSGACLGKVKAGFCYVDKGCQAHGAVRKLSPCEKCDATKSQTTWTAKICPNGQTCEATTGACLATGSGAADAGSDAQAVPSDAATDIAGEVSGTFDAGPVPEDDCDPTQAKPGAFCAACSGNVDCDSALCVDAAIGTVCSKVCVTDCPAGWTCKLVQSTPDVVNACVPVAPNLGRPCILDKDCLVEVGTTAGGANDACLPYGEGEGSLCASKCGPDATPTSGLVNCPSGFTCKDVGTSGHRCVPNSIDAICTARFVKQAAKTICSKKNADGQCKAIRACESVGPLTACTAQVPTPEGCNGQDDDCDGATDEGFAYQGIALGLACAGVGQCGSGVVVCLAGDATEATCSTNPNGTEPKDSDEICNGKDDDCDGLTDDGFDVGESCAAGTGACAVTGKKVCATDAKATVCSAGEGKAPTAEVCNGQDDNCDGSTDEGCDDDEDGWCDATMLVYPGAGCPKGDGDCNDQKANVWPEAKEICDGIDDNCDGTVDEGFDVGAPCSAGIGACLGIGKQVCGKDGGSTECDAVAGKGGAEDCDGADNDCNGQTDEGCDEDGDGFCTGAMTTVGTPAVCQKGGGDCLDDPADAKANAVHPGAPEICNGADDNCNGKTDEDFPALGTDCTVGVGVCLGKGKFVCESDGAGVTCNAKGLDGNACDDGSACTINDLCAQGVCKGTAQGCDDGNPCTDDGCELGAGCTYKPNTAACDDNNPCTSNDTCAAGACVGKPKVCDDGNPCTQDACAQTSGACTATPSSGASCNDGDPCTSSDTCSKGKCMGQAVICDDNNACTTDSCQTGKGCVYTPNNFACSDGNPCTQFDKCGNGACAGAPVSCDDGNPCTKDACNPTTGQCTFSNLGGGCNDANACTSGDACSGGVCQGTPISCDDGNTCTTDACNGAIGCTHVNNSNGCNDGNACTVGDLCTGGACGGQPMNCDDGNACTADACSGGSCAHTPISGCGAAKCGDGKCDFSVGETCSTCKADCGVCVIGLDGCVAQPSLKGNDPAFESGCTAPVCSTMPQCCTSTWDANCAAACAKIEVSGCVGGIYPVSWEKGCAQRGCDCESCVCANDGFCCASGWDKQCAIECWSVSLKAPGAAPPAPSQTVGDCKDIVCLSFVDPMCCSVAWDDICKLECMSFAGC